MQSLLISACLLGCNCKYSGGNNALPDGKLAALRAKYALYPVCPETAGGLPTPRDPSERRGALVISCKGTDVTGQFTRGAETALALSERFGCTLALLKEQSPSCGNGRIYDGSFSGALTGGDGLAAEKLKASGVDVLGESELEKLLREDIKK